MNNQTEFKDIQGMGQPARNTLAEAGYRYVEELTRVSESELKKLHAMGPKALGVLRAELQKRGLDFANGDNQQQEHIIYHKDGSIWGKGTLDNNTEEGYWEWFRKDGTRMRSGHFKKGKQVGEWITYDRGGKVFKVTQMKDQ